MGLYNPHAPRILGNEFVGIRDENLIFNPLANSFERGSGFTLSTYRNITQVRGYINKVSDGAIQNQVTTANIYPRGLEAESGPVRSVLIPCNNGFVTGNAIVANSTSFIGGASTVAQAFWNSSALTGISYRVGELYRSGTAIFFAVDQYANLLSNKRILGVNLLMGVDVGSFTSNGGNDQGFINLYLTNDFFVINGGSNANIRYPDLYTPTTPDTDVRVDRIRLGDVNGYYGVVGQSHGEDNVNISSWTYSELARFEAGNANRIFMYMLVNPVGVSSGSHSCIINYAALEVFYCEETRLGYGSKFFLHEVAFDATHPKYPYTLGANWISIRNKAGTGLILPPGDYTVTLNQSNLGDTYDGLRTGGRTQSWNELRALYDVPTAPGIQVNIPYPLNEEAIQQTLTRQSTLLVPQISLHASGSGGTLYESNGYGRQTAGQVYGASAGAGLSLPGLVGNYASTPDNAALDIVGDLDVRADVTLADWTPVLPMVLVGKWFVNLQLSYLFYIDTSGFVNLGWTANGFTIGVATSTIAPVGVSNGSRLVIRATLDVDNGAAGRTVTFYTAPTMAGPWTQLGAPVVQAGATSIFSSTSIVEVGSDQGGTSDLLNGVVHVVEIRNGINGTVVANPDFSAQAAGTTSFADAAGRTWTLNGSSAAIIASNYLFFGTTSVNQVVDASTVTGTASYPWIRYWARRYGNTTSPLVVKATLFGGLSVPSVPVAAPAVPGAYASTPDAASLDITGDIDLRVDVTLANWANGNVQTLVSKWNGPANFSYRLAVLQNGSLQFAWSTTGAAGGILTSVTANPVTPYPGGRLTVIVQMDADTGGGTHAVVFYVGPTMSGPFTIISQENVAPVTSMFSGNAPLEVGTSTGGTTEPLVGIVHGVQLYNAGVLVAVPDFSSQAAGTTSFVDGATPPKTWTMNGTSRIVALVNSTASIAVTDFDALDEVLDRWREVSLRWDVPVISTNAVGPLLTWTPGAGVTSAGNRYEILGVGAPALTGIPGVTQLNLVVSPNTLTKTTYGQPLNGDVINEGWGPWLGPYVSTYDGGLFIVGTSGSYASTPDNAVLDIVGDIDLRADVTLPATWLTGNLNPRFIAKYGTSANQRSYALGLQSTGVLLMLWSANGIADLTAFSTVVIPIVSGRLSVRATLDVDNGAGGRTITFYTASSVNGPWTQLGAQVVQAGVTSIFSGSAVLESGTINNGTVDLSNELIHVAEVYNGINGTVVANPNFSIQAAGVRTFTDAAGRPWTLNGSNANIIAGTPLADTSSDVSFLLAQDMSPVTGFGATLLSQPVTGIGTKCGLNPPFIPSAISYVRLAWSPTSSSVAATSFGYYQIDRSDSLTDWQTIAKMTSPAASGFTDFEARIGLLSSYRIRAVDEFGFYNAWSSTATITVTAPGVTGRSIGVDDHVLVFTTNASQAGAYNLAYCMAWDGTPLENFTLPEGTAVQMQPMYNRDFFTAFHTTERGGEQFSRDILVQAAAIAPETLADFTSLRSMAWASVPYICVRDEDGNRWFANVSVPASRVQLNRTIYRATVTITEVTAQAAEIEI